jgi:hypothetical protein
MLPRAASRTAAAWRPAFNPTVVRRESEPSAALAYRLAFKMAAVLPAKCRATMEAAIFPAFPKEPAQ